MSKIYFISDTHFFHNRIMSYENRPFETLDKMNQGMVDNWNSVVNEEDAVFHLGDVAVTDNFNAMKNIISKLNGNKILIKGNHDNLMSSSYELMGFNEVYSYPIIFKEFYILSHAPLYVNQNMPYVNIHGHLHWHGSKYDNEKFFNVSVERINYTPIDFEEIVNHFKSFED